jgi:hypothetical protein
VRQGNAEIANYLVERSLKNEGWGFNNFHHLALIGKSDKSVADVKKMNALKKSIGS